jgi:Carboxypeptidase regulatory-like domain
MVTSRAIGSCFKTAGNSRKGNLRSSLMSSVVLGLGMLAFAAVVVSSSAPMALAQSNISGDLIGTVVDATGGAVTNAQVTVTSWANGQVKAVSTNSAGEWRVPLLSPGKYSVSVTAAGFETSKGDAEISTGVNTPIQTRLTVGHGTTTVEVSGSAVALLHSDDAQISTTFDLEQIQNLPNPGNDLTFVAQTAPGAVMNTQGGYGNFSTNGLPATSNTFTVNGGYEGDPYLNLNNSGATNLLLGNNDVEQVTVTTNAYDAAFGGLGGAQVNEISRSGSNQWHGNLAYWWNGRAMNANSWFNKHDDLDRPFENANQWAAAIGGALKKDKIFGFIDTEGLRVIIPVRGFVVAPSPAYQATVLGPGCEEDDTVRGMRNGRRNALSQRPHPRDAASDCANFAPYGNLADNGLSSEAPLIQTIFNYYNNAAGFNSGGIYGAGTDSEDPSSWLFNTQSANLGTEWLVNDRADFNLSSADHLFVHSKVDHGLQPTYTSLLSPLFNAQSPQPSYEGQLSESHTFSPTLTNQFLLAASYYRAIFTNTNASTVQASMPFNLITEGYATSGHWDISGNYVGGIDFDFPQGRNVTGYQFGDDVNWIRGKHNIKVGFTMRRDDISDYTPSTRNFAHNGGEQIILDPGDFAAGYGDEWAERFPLQPAEPVALYVMGAYVQDQWKPMPSLTLTAGLRLEHNSNPTCTTNCISNFPDDFANLATSSSTPYNTLIASGRKRAFLSQQNIAYEPRAGFAYQPGGATGKTTIRGGFGMFADYFPAQIVGDLLANVPNVDRFTILGAAFGSATPLDPSLDGSGHQIAVASNTALQQLYPLGGSYASIRAATGTFSRPTIIGTSKKIFLPSYEEWSLSVEHEIFKNTVVAAQYVGNHGYHEPVANYPNEYSSGGNIPELPGGRTNNSFNQVTEYYSGASSNYNGVIVTVTSRQKWLTEQFNYAHGHALDEVSNGGFDSFGVNPVGQINPSKLSDNYGNADYDVHHYISANYSINVPYFHGPHVLTDNWQVAGTVFHNSGYPFSVFDATGDVVYGAAPLADQVGNNFNHKCGGSSHTQNADGSGNPCDLVNNFKQASGFGNQRRNQLYGPNYTDFDMDIAKGFRLPHWEKAKITIGAQFFNLFNHPNFQIPTASADGLTVGAASASNPNGNDTGLGLITSAATTPTSILGAFLGGDASPRLIQFKGTFVF